MTRTIIERPEEGEYLSYYGRYIALVPEGDILETMLRQHESTAALLGGLSESQGLHRYAPDKWSIKELVSHVSDAERIFADRALRFARNDETPLPGFEENDYVRNGGFDAFSLSDIARGLATVRQSTVSLFQLMSEGATRRRGKANNAEVSVRALAYIIVGHEIHHLNVLRERYL